MTNTDHAAELQAPAPDKVERVARAIYMTHWKAPDTATGRGGSPVWENASDAVRMWVRAQAIAAITAADLFDAEAAAP